MEVFIRNLKFEAREFEDRVDVQVGVRFFSMDKDLFWSLFSEVRFRTPMEIELIKRIEELRGFLVELNNEFLDQNAKSNTTKKWYGVIRGILDRIRKCPSLR